MNAIEVDIAAIGILEGLAGIPDVVLVGVAEVEIAVVDRNEDLDVRV